VCGGEPTAREERRRPELQGRIWLDAAILSRREGVRSNSEDIACE
jgi:hypothetical protein